MEDEIKQLSRFSYELMLLKLSSLFDFEFPVYEELPCDIKTAIKEVIIEILEIQKIKIQKLYKEKESTDIGRVLYSKFLKIRKEHVGIVLYNSIPQQIREKYRKLALEMYNDEYAEEDE